MTKQEKIKEEWIRIYGSEKYEQIKYAINKYGSIDCRKNPEVSKLIDTSSGISWGTTNYFPSSLSGISNNNGWFKKEECFPEDSDVVLWLNIDNSEYELASLLHCDFNHNDYTHWTRINERSPIY